MSPLVGRRPRSLRAFRAAVGDYLAACQGKRLPTVTGLALALGFTGRRELEAFTAASQGALGQLLEQARSLVEEETLQAACRRETASGARFLLQAAFGYGEKPLPDLGPITVTLEDAEGGDAP